MGGNSAGGVEFFRFWHSFLEGGLDLFSKAFLMLEHRAGSVQLKIPGIERPEKPGG